MTVHLDPEIYGCIDRAGYGYTRGAATRRMGALKGRPRYRLMDVRPTYHFTVSFTFAGAGAMAQWQDFWQSVSNGKDWFVATLLLEDLAEYPVKAEGPWTGTLSPAGLWVVTLPLEVSGSIVIEQFCTDIYGGPITGLAGDDIYGGPITGLAGDIIAPCPGVDPNG